MQKCIIVKQYATHNNAVWVVVIKCHFYVITKWNNYLVNYNYTDFKVAPLIALAIRLDTY